MKRYTKFLAGAALLAILSALFQLWYRPWQRTWGATAAEVSEVLPGDDLVPGDAWEATRAITIRATPAAIWPWLIQMGYQRAGFYSWDRLDNDGVPSATRILPEFQRLAEGDVMPLTRDVDGRVVTLAENRVLVLSFKSDSDVPWSWTWSLRPSGIGTTRLVSRLRVGTSRRRTRFVLDAAELFMMRKHLRGIKARAEASSE